MGPLDRSDWCELVSTPLDPAGATSWASSPDCGAIVTFTGVARDHAEGRPGVSALTYEAYEEGASVRLAEVAGELRRRWPEVVKVALLHRTGELEVGDVAVVVAVSAAHRGAAFEAAAFGIDAVKATVPIWKRERWADGEAWGLDARQLVRASEVRSVPGDRAVAR